MCLHNRGRREVAILLCFLVFSFEFGLFLSSRCPCRASLCVLEPLCVMNETGTFFCGPAFLISERINTPLYKMVAGDSLFHSLSQHLSLRPGVGSLYD